MSHRLIFMCFSLSCSLLHTFVCFFRMDTDRSFVSVQTVSIKTGSSTCTKSPTLAFLWRPNSLPATSHQNSLQWFLCASSSCFPSCTFLSSSTYPDTSTHHPPKTLKIASFLRISGNMGTCQNLIFFSHFENVQGLKATLKTLNIFHL